MQLHFAQPDAISPFSDLLEDHLYFSSCTYHILWLIRVISLAAGFM